MARYVLINFLFFISLFFFVVVPKSFATDIVINEFLVDPDSSQWVELYNKGSSSIDISGWFIDDDGGSQKFTIPANTVINSNEFKIFESGLFNLNRGSADTIQLINGSITEDSYNYTIVSGENNSYGRKTDGTGEWVLFSSPTKGSSNNNSTIIPSPTPTLSNTPTPTVTQVPPTPTKTPTPTPTSKPTSTPKPSSSPTPAPTTASKQQTTPVKSSTPTLKSQNNDTMPTAVLGESTEEVNNSLSPSPAVINNSENSGSVFPKIIIAVGVVFIAISGILSFRIYKGKEMIPKFIWFRK